VQTNIDVGGEGVEGVWSAARRRLITRVKGRRNGAYLPGGPSSLVIRIPRGRDDGVGKGEDMLVVCVCAVLFTPVQRVPVLAMVRRREWYDDDVHAI
jgi:hypothetical protein